MLKGLQKTAERNEGVTNTQLNSTLENCMNRDRTTLRTIWAFVKSHDISEFITCHQDFQSCCLVVGE